MSTKEWAHALTPEMREEIKALHEIDPWVSVRKLLALIGIWLSLAVITVNVDSWFVRVPCYIVMGFAFHGLGVFMHEGSHGFLFGKGWIDRVVGFVSGLPLFFSCSNYRATHSLHHRYENTAQDPDNLEATFPNKYLRTFLYYGWYAIGMPVYIAVIIVTGPIRAEGLKEKFFCLLETALMVTLYVTLFKVAGAYGYTDVLIYGWVMVMPFAVVVANVRGLAEHTQLWHQDPPDQLKSTRTTQSNWFVSYFFNNQNYHLEHHLFPRVPWYNLPEVHRVLTPMYDERGASICESYTSYLAKALRYGPMRTVHYTSDRQAILDPPRTRGEPEATPAT